MTLDEKEQLVDMITITAEVMGQELKPGAIMMMVNDLMGYDFPTVARALDRCRRELSGRLTLKAILDIIAPGGEWLTGDEAWSQALPARDERNTVIWTDEARRAWFVALEPLQLGDKVGARMAFLAAYNREVAEAKNAGRRPQFTPSIGDDALLRDAAIRQAQEKGLLAKPAEQPALPPPTPEEEQVMALNRERISEGLHELAQAMHTGVTPEWMQENIEKHKAVVMAELQHEEKGDGLDNTTVQALPSGAGHG